MAKSILITGGARSGKSSFAERMTLGFSGNAIYIATAEVYDAEMAERVREHTARRGPEWHTLHAPLDLIGALRDTDGVTPRLVDCLTLWLTNLMLGDHDWEGAANHLIEAISEQSAPVIFVTNEVGAGIVPENALARRFRDAAGRLNQMVASRCDEVFLTVSGCPIKVKPNEHLP